MIVIRSAAFLLLFATPTLTDLAGDTARSGRIVGIAESSSERLSPPVLLSPGAPPVLSFRYFDASDRGRYGDIGLVADDAGH